MEKPESVRGFSPATWDSVNRESLLRDNFKRENIGIGQDLNGLIVEGIGSGFLAQNSCF